MKDNEYTINVVEQKEHYSSLGRSNYNDSKKKNNIRKISMELKNLESQENEQKNSPEKKEFFPKITNQSQKTNNNINNTKKNNNINNNINNINNNKNTINNNIKNNANINKNNNKNNNINNNMNKKNNISNNNNNNMNNNINNKNNNMNNNINNKNNNMNNNINNKNNNMNNNIINSNNNNNMNNNNLDNNIQNNNINSPVNKSNLDQSMNSSNDKNNNKNTEDYKLKLNNIIKNDFEYQNIFPLIQKGSYLTSLPESIYNNSNNKNTQKNVKYNESTKILKNLKEKEKSLNKEISSIKNKKQKLLNISYINSTSPIEKNINDYEEKRLQSIENNLLEKLDEVKNQIKNIYQRESDLKKNKTNLIQNFLKKYENEENAESLSKKYNLKNNNINTDRKIKIQKDYIQRNQNKLKDNEKSEFKTNQENETKFGNEIEQKLLFLKEQKEKEKEIIKERKKKIDLQILKIKEQAKLEKNPPIKQNYLFYKMENDFEDKEKLFYQNLKLAKKLQVIGKDELKKFQKKFIETRNELQKKAIEKTSEMKKSWKNRSLVLPKYKSPILKIIQKTEREEMEKEEKKQKDKAKFYEEKKNYFKDIIPLPKINEKLRKDIIKKNFSMLDLHGKKRVKYINEELNKINNNRIKSFNIENKRYKQSNCLNKKYKYRITNINKNKVDKNKIEQNKIDKTKINKNETDINKSMELNNNKINKIAIKVTSPTKERIKKSPKDINYLKDFQKNNGFKSYDWERYIEDDENKAISIQNIKNQIEALDDKAERKQILLKMNGGFSNNIKVGNDASNILINSIKGKLSVIKAINKED